jgi:hypothetical protein
MAACATESTNTHLQGQRHENDLRVMLYAQVQQARDAGAEYEALAAMVSKFESAQ